MKSEKTAKELASRVLREYGELVWIGGSRKGTFYKPIETIEIEQKMLHWLGNEARTARIRKSVNLLRKACQLECNDVDRTIIWRKIRMKLDELSQDS